MTKETISEIRHALINTKGHKLSILIEKYKNDTRTGIKKEIKNINKLLQLEKKLKEEYIKISRLENDFYKKGFNLIAGVDEAGRGSFAGPLVAAAVVLPKECYIAGLKECKQLLPDKRKKFFSEIKEKAVDISVVEISWTEIDRIGLHKANLLALNKAVEQLKNEPDFILSDGFKIETSLPSLKIIKGDTISVSIAAASIIAKVYRDNLMDGYHAEFPEYGFDKNKGYGTKKHMEVLEKLGPTRIHRQSFDPVKICLAGELKL